jgi:group II intron reverse transcriptase/maturase
MYNPKWVWASLKLVLANKGSRTAGSDGITKQHLKDKKNREAFVRSIVYELKNDLYEPQPAKRIHIDKSGGDKRPLSIPTIKDRVVQQTLKLIIEPIFESDFKNCSIGFRPNRCCHDALPTFYRSITSLQKYFYVIKCDISKCFDTICHKTLLKIIKRRIKDKRLLGLISKVLSAGYIENGVANKPGYGIPALGTPQGGIISPLFANIYLNEFDKWFENNYGSGLTKYQKMKRRKLGYGNAKLLRYADDCVILYNGGKNNIENLKEQVKQFLNQELRLELSDEKTHITHANKGFEFLGFHVRRYKRNGKYMTLTSVPLGKIGTFKKKIQSATRRKGAKYESVTAKIIAMNSIILGYAEYYKYTNWKADGIPSILDYFIGGRTFRWAKWKHVKATWKKINSKYKHRQRGYRLDGGTIDRWNFGVRTEASYVTDEEVLWLAKLSDKRSERYLPKKKPNPFITFQYEVELLDDILDKWEGRSSLPYISDEYLKNKKLALKRDKYQCRNCGKKVVVGVDNHCHHIDGDSSNHSLNNLATLCLECHYHTYEKEHELNF